MRTARLYLGDCREVLRTMSAASVHCVVTSPPYYGLRDYRLEPVLWPDGWRGCLGLEPSPEMFVEHLLEVFREVRRVLRPDGVAFLNLGDSYWRVPVEECKRRALEFGRRRHGATSAAEFADAIWPDAEFHAQQGAGAAASRILKSLERDGRARWVSDRRRWGWIVR